VTSSGAADPLRHRRLIDFLRGRADARAELLGIPIARRLVHAVVCMELLVGARDHR
jgi:hypothetical protein